MKTSQYYSYSLLPTDPKTAIQALADDWFGYDIVMKALDRSPILEYDSRVNPSDSKISFFDTLYSRAWTITTLYDCSIERSEMESRQSDIIETLRGFKNETWVVTILIAIILAMLFKIHMRMNQVRANCASTSGFWIVLSYLLNNPSAMEINRVSRYLSFLIAMFTFTVIICYFESGIISDKVVVYDPLVYRSYAQLANDDESRTLIALDVIGFLESYQDYYGEPIGELDSNSMKLWNIRKNAELWELSIKGFYLGYLLKFVFSKDMEKKVLLGLGEGIGFDLCQEMIKHSEFDIKDLCFYEHRNGNYDADEQEFIDRHTACLAWPISIAFTKKPIYRKYYRYYRRAYEMALVNRAYQASSNFEHIVTPTISDCVPQASPVKHSKEDYEGLGLSNYQYALYSLLIPLLFASLSLNYEYFIAERYRKNNNIKIIPLTLKKP